MIPDAPQLGVPWALAEAQAFHFRGVRRSARGERAAAEGRAEQDAPAYLAAETARLNEVRQQLAAEAEQWWQFLISNDEDTLYEAVNTTFSDNPAAGCAVGVDGSTLSVVMRQQDLDSMPTQTPGLTSSGRPRHRPGAPVGPEAGKARGHFPNEQAALKCVYMAIMSLDPTSKGQGRWTMRWQTALNAFDITFDGRLPAARR